MLAVQDYIDYYIKIWDQSPKNSPVFQREYSLTEQNERESYYEEFQKKLKTFQSPKKIQNLRKDPGNSFFPMFKGFLQTVFDFEKDQLEIVLSEEFKNVSKDFFYKARAFGPELTPENIYQGIRNVWIMNGVQLLLNVAVEITPSVFAYSMIYPYSDNLLDDPSITKEEKQLFSIRFDKRLKGKNVIPVGFAEAQLFKLVGMFEEQYSRKEFPLVYESLYAIQQGQTNSLKLIESTDLSKNEIQNICFEKGGASVLADGYLVAGRLTKEQEKALFAYGIYLQLLDDIQDVREDSNAATKTMFSCENSRDMGEFVNQTIHFGRVVLDEMKCFPHQNLNIFLDLMKCSIETMIIESVGLNHVRYTEEYLHDLEKYSPLGFEFIRKKRTQSKSQRFAVFQKYFNQAASVSLE